MHGRDLSLELPKARRERKLHEMEVDVRRASCNDRRQVQYCADAQLS
jgi:hypothetical protein